MALVFNNSISLLSLFLHPILQQSPINMTDLNSEITLRIILSYTTAENSLLNALLTLEIPKVIVIGANLTDLPTQYYPIENVPAHEFPPLSALQLSTNIETRFVFLPSATSSSLTPSMKINNDYKLGQLHSRTPLPFKISPLRTHYIFVGNKRALQFVFSLEQIQLLKYKTGIQVDGQSPALLITEKYTEGSRDSLYVQTKWAEFGSIYQDKFGLIRNRKLHVWSTPAQVYYNKQGKPSGGLTYNVPRSIAEHYNCTLEFEIEGWRNVGQNPNGTWDGYIGALIDNKIDIGMVLQLTSRRVPYIDVPAYCLFETFGFITPVPGHTLNWQAILHLLEPNVFIAVGLSCLLFSLMLYTHYRSHHPNVTEIDRLYFSLFSPLSFFIQRPLNLPSGTRTLAGVFLPASIVVGVCFESNLLALLTQLDEDIIPKTAKEVNVMRKFRVDFINYPGTIGEIYMKEPARLDIQGMLPRTDARSYRNLVESLTRTALGKKTVTLTYQKTGFLSVAANLTVFPNIYPVQRGEVLLNAWAGPVVRKYSKLSEIVKLSVRRLDETGHHLKWLEEALEVFRRRGATWMKAEKRTLYKKLKNEAFQLFSSQAKPLTLVNVTFVYFCLAVGSAFAIVVYVLEALLDVVGRRVVDFVPPN